MAAVDISEENRSITWQFFLMSWISQPTEELKLLKDLVLQTVKERYKNHSIIVKWVTKVTIIVS